MNLLLNGSLTFAVCLLCFVLFISPSMNRLKAMHRSETFSNCFSSFSFPFLTFYPNKNIHFNVSIGERVSTRTRIECRAHFNWHRKTRMEKKLRGIQHPFWSWHMLLAFLQITDWLCTKATESWENAIHSVNTRIFFS